jgi:NAD(P)H-hydrate epimerase
MILKRDMPCIGSGDDEGLLKLAELVKSSDVVIDALFGTGKSRPISGIYQKVLKEIARIKEERPELKIMALDLPSGLDADSGAADSACLNADYTVTLGMPKAGLFQPEGAEKAGRIIAVDIGIPESLTDEIRTEVLAGNLVKKLLPARRMAAHKGSFGRVIVVAGSVNYTGAAYLACSGAIRVGAGLVTLATPKGIQPVLASQLIEVTHYPLDEAEYGVLAADSAGKVLAELNNYDVLLAGCGIGQHKSVAGFIKNLIAGVKSEKTKAVLDADALNILAKQKDWWQQFKTEAIITPHPGEMSRLAGITVAELQHDRIGVARRMAEKWNKVIVLKGAYTVVAAPDGRCLLSDCANPGLASAGTGDVLAGAVAGLLAQGLPLFEAAACGVYLHSVAGDMAREKTGDAGTIASDLLPLLPLAIKELKEND